MSATPADLIAFSESPPPTTLTAPESATALTYATRAGHAPIDRALYLPASWARDQERCAAAGVPADLEFATKPELARQMIVRALLMTVEYASMVCGPISSPIIPSGTRLATWFAAPAFISEATT